MRMFVAICALSLSVISCASDGTRQDSFAALHDLVKQTLAGSSDCGPVTTNEVVGGRYFEVKPEPRGLPVSISERRFYSQVEWEKCYASGMASDLALLQFALTNHPIDSDHPIDTNALLRLPGVTNAFSLSELPEWHYRNIGVDVWVQAVDETYSGVERDNAEAQKRYQAIIKLLEPYHRANKALQPTAIVPPVLTKP